MSRYISRAVAALYLAIAGEEDVDPDTGPPRTVVTPFEVELRAIETLENLAENSLESPIAYRRAHVATDPRARLVMIDDMGGGYHDGESGQRNRIAETQCSVLLVLTSDTDVEAGKARMRLWVAAMLETLRKGHALIDDRSVLGFRIGPWETATGAVQLPGHSSANTRHYAMIDVDVDIHHEET